MEKFNLTVHKSDTEFIFNNIELFSSNEMKPILYASYYFKEHLSATELSIYMPISSKLIESLKEVLELCPRDVKLHHSIIAVLVLA
jgi:hypothetical protein